MADLIMKPGGHGTARVPGHTAIIKDGISACTCRVWNGPRRSDDETYGEYTTRAYGRPLAAQRAGNQSTRTITRLVLVKGETSDGTVYVFDDDTARVANPEVDRVCSTDAEREYKRDRKAAQLGNR